jgi:hypothetical protein
MRYIDLKTLEVIERPNLELDMAKIVKVTSMLTQGSSFSDIEELLYYRRSWRFTGRGREKPDFLQLRKADEPIFPIGASQELVLKSINSLYEDYFTKLKERSEKNRNKRGEERQGRIDRINSLKSHGINLDPVLDRIKNEEMDVLLSQIEKATKILRQL